MNNTDCFKPQETFIFCLRVYPILSKFVKEGFPGGISGFPSINWEFLDGNCEKDNGNGRLPHGNREFQSINCEKDNGNDSLSHANWGLSHDNWGFAHAK